MTDEVKKTTLQMAVGSVVFSVLFAVIVLIIMKCYAGWERIHTEVLAGFLAGGLLAAFMAVHMAVSLSKSVEMDEKNALNHTRKTYAIRTVIVLAIVVALFYTGFFNILAMLGGILCLKPAAYMGIFFQNKDYEPVDENAGDVIEEE